METPRGCMISTLPREILMTNLKDRDILVDFAAWHYFPESRWSELEGPLIGAKMFAPIYQEKDLQLISIERMTVATSSICIDFVRSMLGINEKLYTALSRAAANAIAVGPSRCFVISYGYVSDIVTLIAHLYESSYFRSIWESEGSVPQSTWTPKRSREEAIARMFETPAPLTNMPLPLYLGLVGFCIEFTAFHELGHLVNGHLSSGGSEIAEMATIDDRDKLLTRRALEMDADAFAVQKCLEWIQMRTDTLSSNHGFLKDKQTAWITMIAAIFLVIIAMDRTPSKALPDYCTFTHPPPYIRGFEVLAVVNRVFERWRDERGLLLPDNWFERILRVRGAIESAIAEVGESGWDVAAHERWLSVMIQHDTQLLARYAKLRPDLDRRKLGRFNVLAAAQESPA